MSNPSSSLYFIAPLIAIVGATLYHVFLKKLPDGINPLFSLAVIYSFSLIISLILLPFFGGMTSMRSDLSQISWVHIVISISVIMIEIGYLLMYRSGWDLSLGNLTTGVAVNIALLALGILLFREHLSGLKVLGASLAIIGVALLSL